MCLAVWTLALEVLYQAIHETFDIRSKVNLHPNECNCKGPQALRALKMLLPGKSSAMVDAADVKLHPWRPLPFQIGMVD